MLPLALTAIIAAGVWHGNGSACGKSGALQCVSKASVGVVQVAGAVVTTCCSTRASLELD